MPDVLVDAWRHTFVDRSNGIALVAGGNEVELVAVRLGSRRARRLRVVRDGADHAIALSSREVEAKDSQVSLLEAATEKLQTTLADSNRGSNPRITAVL
ncbi:hypothetical protein EYZ11_008086 [Aspergillus tanneri]|uniref:Uncharacterized protein n=1 Tax=Aspergillus tanneri TaxID=1220188 RepID=A0A4V6RQR9_9EURO|nr:hypothetical protein EYZ11_008086 [Aspergillus tanneri]